MTGRSRILCFEQIVVWVYDVNLFFLSSIVSMILLRTRFRLENEMAFAGEERVQMFGTHCCLLIIPSLQLAICLKICLIPG